MDAAFVMAELYGQGVGVEASESARLEWLERAAALDHPIALLQYGVYCSEEYDRLTAENDPKTEDARRTWASKAVKMFERGAELKNTSCMFNLAACMLNGDLRLPKDREGALRLLKDAAELDEPNSLHVLGCGADRPQQAIEYFKRAANLGHAPSMHSLGSMMLQGIGVAKNRDEAVAWLRKAAALGFNPSVDLLGDEGEDVLPPAAVPTKIVSE